MATIGVPTKSRVDGTAGQGESDQTRSGTRRNARSRMPSNVAQRTAGNTRPSRHRTCTGRSDRPSTTWAHVHMMASRPSRLLSTKPVPNESCTCTLTSLDDMQERSTSVRVDVCGSGSAVGRVATLSSRPWAAATHADRSHPTKNLAPATPRTGSPRKPRTTC